MNDIRTHCGCGKALTKEQKVRWQRRQKDAPSGGWKGPFCSTACYAKSKVKNHVPLTCAHCGIDITPAKRSNFESWVKTNNVTDAVPFCCRAHGHAYRKAAKAKKVER